LEFTLKIHTKSEEMTKKTTTIGAAVSHDHGLEGKRHITTNSGAGARQKALIPRFVGFNRVSGRWGPLSGARCRFLTIRVHLSGLLPLVSVEFEVIYVKSPNRWRCRRRSWRSTGPRRRALAPISGAPRRKPCFSVPGRPGCPRIVECVAAALGRGGAARSG
jgi:hypothetical protein